MGRIACLRRTQPHYHEYGDLSCYGYVHVEPDRGDRHCFSPVRRGNTRPRKDTHSCTEPDDSAAATLGKHSPEVGTRICLLNDGNTGGRRVREKCQGSICRLVCGGRTMQAMFVQLSSAQLKPAKPSLAQPKWMVHTGEL